MPTSATSSARRKTEFRKSTTNGLRNHGAQEMKIIPAIPSPAAAAPPFAQRDFLTTDEIEKVREAQEPNLRLKLYIVFARQRMDQFQQLLKKDKKGRSLEARELLEDYASIIDAIDNVEDDALKRHVDLKEGLEAVAAAEKRFLSQLEKIEETPPADIQNYDVAFKEAKAATSDSMELAQTDTGKRAEELTAKEAQEKKQSRSILAAEDGKASADAAAATATEDAKPKREAADPDAARRKAAPQLNCGGYGGCGCLQIQIALAALGNYFTGFTRATPAFHGGHFAFQLFVDGEEMFHLPPYVRKNLIHRVDRVVPWIFRRHRQNLLVAFDRRPPFQHAHRPNLNQHARITRLLHKHHTSSGSLSSASVGNEP